MSKISFSVYCDQTQPGDSVYIVGNTEDLGSWQLCRTGVILSTGAEWPLWHGEFFSSGNSRSVAEFKIVIKRADGHHEWCPNKSNHKATFRQYSDYKVDLAWGDERLDITELEGTEMPEGVRTPLPCPAPSNMFSDGIHAQIWHYMDSTELINSLSDDNDNEVSDRLTSNLFSSLNTTDCIPNSPIHHGTSKITSIINGPAWEDYAYDLHSDLIGDGMSGRVFRGTCKTTGEKVAIKEMSKLCDRGELDAIRRECLILQQLSCYRQSIIGLVNIYEDASYVYLVMEWGGDGDLFSFLTENDLQFIEEDVLRSLFRSLLDAVHICHLNHIVHRDLKPENFLLFYDDMDSSTILNKTHRTDIKAKLIDFGLSDFCSPHLDTVSGLAGSTDYIAPEALESLSKHTEYGHSCDLWALGCIMYLFMEGCPPFFYQDDDTVFNAIRYDEFPKAAVQRSGNFYKYSYELQDLVIRLLDKNPRNRPTAEKALSHVWFSSESPSRSHSVLEKGASSISLPICTATLN